MAEVINTNVFDAEKKFVDFAGLDYFWSKAKTYIDGVDATMSAKVLANEGEITKIWGEIGTLSGGVGSVDSQIDAKIAALNLPNTYEAKGVAASEAAGALAAAKTYVGEEIAKLSFDEAGTAKSLADAAEAAAKSYADGKDSAMDARVKVLEGIDHDVLAADAAASAVATILDDAPAAFDTLKEVAQWISDSETSAEAANLVVRVGNLESINHEAYVAADAQVLADAKSYVDGKVDGKFDAINSAATAEANAKAYTDTEIGKLSFDEAGTAKSLADAAEAAAKAYADGKDSAMNTRVAAVEAREVYVSADVNNAIAAAEAAAKADAATKLASYYTKTEVDNLLSTNSTGDRAYAKQYTDELFGSFKFAANSDIDALFAAKAE